MGPRTPEPPRNIPIIEYNPLFGLLNYNGVTCYANSVMQVLLHLPLFRTQILSTLAAIQSAKENVEPLQKTFAHIFSQWFSDILKVSTGTLDLKSIMEQISEFNEQYKHLEQQDAQEFMQWLFNQLSDELKKYSLPDIICATFEGTTLAQTKCMCCEKVTSTEETFMFLTLEVERHTSLTDALHHKFLATEVLKGENKFFCGSCVSYQEAEKTCSFKKLPSILTIQFKRFKYLQAQQRFVRLDYRVEFPFEIRIGSSQDAETEKASLYELSAIIMHSGPGIQSGHYYAIIRMGKKWMVFDDSKVYEMDKAAIDALVGCRPGDEYGGAPCPYILLFSIVNPK